MRDRLMLEAAARVAGLTIQDGWAYDAARGLKVVLAGGTEWWNPRTDDGASRRLAMTLRLTVVVRAQEVLVYGPAGQLLATVRRCTEDGDITPEHPTDLCDAARLAVLQAAVARDNLAAAPPAVAQSPLSPLMPQAVVAAYSLPDGNRIELAAKHGAPTRWAVRDGFGCLARDGSWVAEPSHSSRDDAFLARCRYATAEEAYAAWEATNQA